MIRFLTEMTLAASLLLSPLSAFATTASPVKVYRSVETDCRRIALTFDDGPHPRQTREILDVLAEYNVRATFFMVGENVANYSDAARAVAKAGHEIGNHTFTHCPMSAARVSELETELEMCEEIIEKVCGCEPSLFRPPQGCVTSFVESCAAEGEYKLILWSLDTRDWEGRDADAIAQTVLREVRPGAIILMHDYIGKNAHTAEALRIILPRLLEDGYELVSVSELLSME